MIALHEGKLILCRRYFRAVVEYTACWRGFVYGLSNASALVFDRVVPSTHRIDALSGTHTTPGVGLSEACLMSMCLLSLAVCLLYAPWLGIKVKY